MGQRGTLSVRPTRGIALSSGGLSFKKAVSNKTPPPLFPGAKVGDYQSALGEQAHRRPQTWGVVAMGIGLL